MLNSEDRLGLGQTVFPGLGGLCVERQEQSEDPWPFTVCSEALYCTENSSLNGDLSWKGE